MSTKWNLDTRDGLIQKMRDEIQGLFPGYFALVMATGIVSLAAHFLEMESIAWLLFWLNNGLYVLLVGLTLARVLLVPRQVLKDMADHQTGCEQKQRRREEGDGYPFASLENEEDREADGDAAESDGAGGW